MTHLPPCALETAPKACRALTRWVMNQHGFPPKLIEGLSKAPAALETYFTVSNLNA